MRTTLKTLMGIEAIVLLLLAAAHFGLPIPWFAEPRVIQLAVIEGLCGLAILYASLHGGARTAFTVQWLAFAGVLIGMVGLALSGAPRTPLTEFGHVLVLAMTAPGALIADRLARD